MLKKTTTTKQIAKFVRNHTSDFHQTSHLHLVEWLRVNDVFQTPRRAAASHLCAISEHKVAICFDCIYRSRRVEHWFGTTGSFSVWLHQNPPPVQLPSPGLPGIRVLHRSSICISSSDFPCDGFSRSKPAGAPRLYCTCASISKAIRAERERQRKREKKKNLWKFFE